MGSMGLYFQVKSHLPEYGCRVLAAIPAGENKVIEEIIAVISAIWPTATDFSSLLVVVVVRLRYNLIGVFPVSVDAVQIRQVSDMGSLCSGDCHMSQNKHLLSRSAGRILVLFTAINYVLEQQFPLPMLVDFLSLPHHRFLVC